MNSMYISHTVIDVYVKSSSFEREHFKRLHEEVA
ncbi:hypothetical protein BA1DRAFT_01517 [Photorhabdus aegyptia]|uniref:Uncharacterized protein n=1 Tax=Photorhabdus aegyptia TaxID=2805098 RepID=A0A022PID2_9GAMM|nr:hypothetical protein BA1DRAFT_01517 [Photorhabdus aegyptia]